MKRLLFLMMAFCCMLAQAQTTRWVTRYAPQAGMSDRFQFVKRMPDGRIVAAGKTTRQISGDDMLVVCYTPTGDTSWSWSWDGPRNMEDVLTGLAVSNTGDVFVCGYTDGPTGLNQAVVARLSSNGQELWVQRNTTAQESEASGVAVTPNGFVYVTGFARNLGGTRDWMVMRYSLSGSLTWTDMVNGSGNGGDESTDIVPGPGNSVAVTGTRFQGATNKNDLFLRLYSGGATSAYLWEDTVNIGNKNERGMEVLQAPNGDWLVGGLIDGQASTSSRSFLAARFSSTGQLLWTAVPNDAQSFSRDDEFHGMSVDGQGRLTIGGHDFNNWVISSFGTNGQVLFSKRLNGLQVTNQNPFNLCFGVAHDSQGNIYGTGRQIKPGSAWFGNGGDDDLAVVKLRPNGDSVWTVLYPPTPGNVEMGFNLLMTPGDTLAVVGFSTDTAYFNEDATMLKLDTNGNILQEHRFNGLSKSVTTARFVGADAVGNTWVAGIADRLMQSGTDIILAKFGPNGQRIRNRFFTTSGHKNDSITSLIVRPDGSFFVGFVYDSLNNKTNYNAAVAAFDSTGQLLWYRDLPKGQQTNDWLNQLILGPNNRLWAVAQIQRNGFERGMVVALDATNGQIQFANVTDSLTVGSNIHRVSRAALTPSGELVLAGHIRGFVATSVRAALWQFAATGALVDTVTYDSLNVADQFNDVVVDAQGFVYAIGNNGPSGVAIRYDNGLNRIWFLRLNLTNRTEAMNRCRLDQAGNLFVMGTTSNNFNLNWIVAKVNATTAQLLWFRTPTPGNDRQLWDFGLSQGGSFYGAGYETLSTSTNQNFLSVKIDSTATGAIAWTAAWTGFTTNNTPDWGRGMELQNDWMWVVGETSQQFINQELYEMVLLSYGVGTPVQTLAVTTSVVNVTCRGAANGRISLTISGGSAPYTITSPVGTVSGNQILNVPAGTHQISVNDGSGQSWNGPVTITQPARFDSARFIFVTNNLQVQFSNLSSQGTYFWDFGNGQTSTSTNPVIAFTAAGTYNVCLRVTTNCLVDTFCNSVTVTAPAALVVAPSVTNVSCRGAATGRVDLVISGGTLAYNITANRGAVVGNSVRNLTAGQVTVNVSDAGGQSWSQTLTITEPARFDSAAFTNIANGLNVQFSNQSSAGTYSWVFGDGGTSTQTNPTYTYTQPGTYNVCLTVTTACTTRTECRNVAVFLLGSGELASPQPVLYPQPSTDGLVYLKNTNSAHWQLLDAQGRMVDQGRKVAEPQLLNFSQLPKGIYWLKLDSGSVLKLIR